MPISSYPKIFLGALFPPVACCCRLFVCFFYCVDISSFYDHYKMGQGTILIFIMCGCAPILSSMILSTTTPILPRWVVNLQNFSLPPLNQKENDQSHLGDLDYILCWYKEHFLAIFWIFAYISLSVGFFELGNDFDVTVTTFLGCWYLFFYVWKEETLSYTIVPNLGVSFSISRVGGGKTCYKKGFKLVIPVLQSKPIRDAPLDFGITLAMSMIG